MYRRKDFGILSGTIGLVAVVLVLTIVWAAFSTTLTIKGAASVTKSSWSIKFQNLQTYQRGNTVSGRTSTATQVTAPTISNNTTLGTFSVKLLTPGDYIYYDVDVKNDGTFPAKVTAVGTPTITCSTSSFCSNLTYSITYSDGTAIAVNDTLAVNATKTLRVKLLYKDTTAQASLPTSDVTVTVSDWTITYTQV